MKLNYKYVAESQYGETVFIKDYPRKELCERHGVKHANKMFVDTKDGKAHHIGYVVSGNWYTVWGLECNIFTKD